MLSDTLEGMYSQNNYSTLIRPGVCWRNVFIISDENSPKLAVSQLCTAVEEDRHQRNYHLNYTASILLGWSPPVGGTAGDISDTGNLHWWVKALNTSPGNKPTYINMDFVTVTMHCTVTCGFKNIYAGKKQTCNGCCRDFSRTFASSMSDNCMTSS